MINKIESIGWFYFQHKRESSWCNWLKKPTPKHQTDKKIPNQAKPNEEKPEKVAGLS